MKPDTIDIIELLDKFSNSKTRQEEKMHHKQNQKIIHYTYEILRNWNKINIIYINISKKIKKKPLEKTLGFFIIYRVKWENATINEILNNISKLIIKKNKKDHYIIIRFIKEIEKFSWEILFSKLTQDAILS